MSDSRGERTTNRLATETSAYLRQHMHNPVDWYPWGEEALTRASDEDKPLLVSIGYSACHWCHVMERESFEDPQTAELMNRLFVNVKVDREERPDVDQIYMDAVVGLRGQGGWPLTVFCLPDGTPFEGATYFPPEPRHGMPAFRQVLVAVHDAYRERRQALVTQGARVVEAISRRPRELAGEPAGHDSLAQAAQRLLQRADPDNGGFGTAPKFPTPPYLFALLAAVDVLPERKANEALEHCVKTCHEMSRGGVYDQVGGGFHRYSVDADWGVPHFEKMLYDQGQLLSAYIETWRRSGAADDDLLWPVRETVDFLRREMCGPEGGLYASLDADSEGAEGTFYVWTPDQIESVLDAEASAAFCRAHGVTRHGNFEHGTTVLRDASQEPRERWARQRELLRRAREKRPRPATDTKRVASWNALAISGLARAGSLLGDPSMLGDAVHAADFVLEQMRDGEGRLLRVWNLGRAHVPGFLDDLAAMLEACLELHRAGAGDRFLAQALHLADDLATRFFDAEEGDLFLTPADGEPLVLRPRSDHDGAMPHSPGLAVLGLLRVATLCGRDDLRRVADTVLRRNALGLERAPEAFPTLARAAALAARGLSVAVVVGDASAAGTGSLAARARLVLAPEDAVLVLAPGARLAAVDPTWTEGRETLDGHPTAYVCRGATCSLPVTDAQALAPLSPGAAT